MSSRSKKVLLVPSMLVQMYETFQADFPTSTRPAIQIAVMTNKKTEVILSIANELGYAAKDEDAQLTGQQIVTILKRLYDL